MKTGFDTKVARIVLAVALLAAGGGAMGAREHDAHGAAPEAAQALRLDHGRRWATDAPLREGMAQIHRLVQASWGRPFDAAAAARLARDVEGRVGEIVAKCKLEPAADAVLHVTLERVLAGVEELKRPEAETRHAGLARIGGAVAEFYAYFDARP